MSLTFDRAFELLDYCETDGLLRWKVDRKCGKGRVIAAAGAVAGTSNQGYVVVQIDRRLIAGHRVIWLLKTGSLPGSDVDHIDGDRANNRWSNLREVTRSVNLQNQRRAHKDNKTGLLGVYEGRGGKYLARISLEGKTRSLGSFQTPEEAHRAYLTAKRDVHEGCTL